ncbi:hypothetical protein N9H10_01580 [Luminiphilus sp.]|nr:hypothetical protein [Luminiphilus sp.]MDA8985742.1 hypothetical protein [Luminiphilus sp.]
MLAIQPAIVYASAPVVEYCLVDRARNRWAMTLPLKKRDQVYPESGG